MLNDTITQANVRPDERFSPRSKKLPRAKLFFASLSLVVLIVASKNLFSPTAAKSVITPHPSNAPAILGTQSSQTQVQPSAAAPSFAALFGSQQKQI
jgi:hypothetical protein